MTEQSTTEEMKRHILVRYSSSPSNWRETLGGLPCTILLIMMLIYLKFASESLTFYFKFYDFMALWEWALSMCVCMWTEGKKREKQKFSNFNLRPSYVQSWFPTWCDWLRVSVKAWTQTYLKWQQLETLRRFTFAILYVQLVHIQFW